MKCLLCGSDNFIKIHKGVRGNSDIDVMKCCDCGLVRLSDFPSDLEKYYEASQMRRDDEEKDLREIRAAAYQDDSRRVDFIGRMIENKTYLDFGCGAGGTKAGRKICKKCLWNRAGESDEGCSFKRRFYHVFIVNRGKG